MLKLQRDEKKGESILLVVKLEKDGVGMAAGKTCTNAVYQRVRHILNVLCKRGHFGMYCWGEIDCTEPKCTGTISLDKSCDS